MSALQAEKEKGAGSSKHGRAYSLLNLDEMHDSGTIAFGVFLSSINLVVSLHWIAKL